jgi:hypothetical protein
MSRAQQHRLRSSQQHFTTGSQGARSLQLPGVPRFHPANFPLSNSSMQKTSTSGFDTPQPSVSPGSQQRQQRALSAQERDFYYN